MVQPIGSVYLDAPPRPRYQPPEPRVSRTRAVIAGLCVTVGLLALTLAAIVGGLRMVVLDVDPVTRAFEATIDDPTARAELQREVAHGIEAELVGDELAAIAAAFELDVASEAQRVSLLVLDDPVVRDELLSLVTELHSRVLLDPTPTDLDLENLTAAVLVVIERESPRLASVIPANTVLWRIPGESLPDLSYATALLDRSLMVLLLAALFAPLGAAVHPQRHRVAAWVGRWALSLGLLCALASIGLPVLGGRITGWASVEIALQAESLRLLAPGGLAGVFGVGLLSLAAVSRRHERRQVLEEGAAAALGYDEPPFWQQTSSPTIDLARRGLVDADRPLTNI